jgi:hypothetical protein
MSHFPDRGPGLSQRTCGDDFVVHDLIVLASTTFAYDMVARP